MENKELTKDQFYRLESALKTDAKIKGLTELLAKDKIWITENLEAGQTYPIKGYGKVQVKNGAKAKDEEAILVTTFNPEKFKELPKSQQEKLKALGVVTVTPTIIPAKPQGNPSVAFIHND